MKLYCILLLTALLSASSLLHAADDDTPLEKQMQTLARGMRQLSMQVSDPSKQQSTIILIESLKKAATDSESLGPRKTATIPVADRAQFLSAFKAQMQKLADTFGQMEEVIKAGQYDKAKSLLGNLQGLKKEGHEKFKQD